MPLHWAWVRLPQIDNLRPWSLYATMDTRGAEADVLRRNDMPP